MEQKIEFMELDEIINSDEEFYEHIEAPKFFDFTQPDRYRPVNDRYWFCSRVGCDQKHEEEMDSEAIYKKFVLRVMAARSPNVRLRKTLNSNLKKCPLSAPPKPSRSRVIPRLAVVTSLSQKFADVKRKIGPSSKTSPKAKGRHVSAKYMTSPRNKKHPSNPNPFRSVRNPKRSSSSRLPKTKAVVAKALVFSSPKKPIKGKGKSQVELSTPVTKLCEGMKKLEITSQKKASAQNSLKVSRSRDVRKVLPSGKQASAHKVRIRSDNLSGSKGNAVVKSSKCPGNIINRDAKKQTRQNVQDGGAVEVCRDVDINEKTGTGSLGVPVKKGHDMINHVGQECLEIVESLINTGSGVSHEEATASSDGPKTDAVSSYSRKYDMDSTPNAEIVDGAYETETATHNEAGKESREQENIKSDSLKGNVAENLDLEAGQENNMDNDDKENALPSNINRELNSVNHQSRRDASSKRSMALKSKVIQTPKKTLKENCAAGVASQGVKYKKPKLTNPKPFRLRTDERGILKESAIEKKLHETTNENSRCKSEGKDQGFKKDLERRSKKPQIRTAFKKTTKQYVGATADESSHRRQPLSETKDGKGKAESPYPGKSSRVAKKTSMLQKDVLRSQRPMNYVKNPSAGSNTVREISTPLLNQKGTGKQNQCVGSSTNKAKPSAIWSRSCGRNQTTMSEESNIHTRHVPSSCTRHT